MLRLCNKSALRLLFLGLALCSFGPGVQSGDSVIDGRKEQLFSRSQVCLDSSYVTWGHDFEHYNKNVSINLKSMDNAPSLTLKQFFSERNVGFERHRSSLLLERALKDPALRSKLVNTFLSKSEKAKKILPKLLQYSQCYKDEAKFFALYSKVATDCTISEKQLKQWANEPLFDGSVDKVRFYIDLHNKMLAAYEVYHIFLVNDAVRGHWHKQLLAPKADPAQQLLLALLGQGKDASVCDKCCAATQAKFKLLQEKIKGKPERVQQAYLYNFSMVMCPKHKIYSYTGGGVLAPFDKHGKRQFDLPKFAFNPTLFYPVSLDEDGGSAILSNGFIEDLRLFRGDEKHPSEDLISRLKRTQTIFGDPVFERLFLKPVKKITVLERRQALIKKGLEDDKFYQSVRACLSKVQEAQNEIATFIASNSNTELGDENTLFSVANITQFQMLDVALRLTGWTWIKNLQAKVGSSTGALYAIPALKLVSLLHTIAVPVHWMMSGVSKSIPTVMGLSADGKVHLPGCKDDFDRVRKHPWQELWAKDDRIKLLAKAVNDSFRRKGEKIERTDMLGIFSRFLGAHSSNHAARFAMAASMFLMVGPFSLFMMLPPPSNFAAYGFFKMGEQAIGAGEAGKRVVDLSRHSLSSYKRICKQLKALKQLAIGLKGLSQILAKHPELAAVCKLSPTLRNFVAGVKSQDRELLKDMLAYQGNSVVRAPFNISALHRINARRWNLSMPIEAIGEIDAFVSAITLMRQSKGHANGFCFAQYDPAGRTGFDLKDFWNPYYAPDKAVVNSLSFGLDNRKDFNMLLGGPNANGKSTILRALATNLLLAQVFGIAAASICITGIYDNFLSWMSTKDDPAGGLSKFAAETKMMEDLKRNVQFSSRYGLKTALFIDEIYSATGEQSALPMALPYLKFFGNDPLVSAMISSHFYNLLRRVGDYTGHKFSNYRVVIKRDEKGGVIKTFKVEPGLPDEQKDAVGIYVAAENGADPEMIREAHRLQAEFFAQGK